MWSAAHEIEDILVCTANLLKAVELLQVFKFLLVILNRLNIGFVQVKSHVLETFFRTREVFFFFRRLRIRFRLG